MDSTVAVSGMEIFLLIGAVVSMALAGFGSLVGWAIMWRDLRAQVAELRDWRAKAEPIVNRMGGRLEAEDRAAMHQQQAQLTAEAVKGAINGIPGLSGSVPQSSTPTPRQ